MSTVHLVVEEPGASVFVDDEPVGTAPLAEPLLVDLGSRKLRVSKPGFKEYVVVQDFAGGSEVTFNVALHPAVHEGRLVVEASRGDSIRIDGSAVGDGHYEGRLASGPHTVRITAPNFVPSEREIVLHDGEQRTLNVTLEPNKSGLPVFVWVGGAILAAGGLSVGAYFLFRPTERSAPTEIGTLSPGTIPLP